MPRSGVRNRANKGIDFPLYHTFAALPTSRDRIKGLFSYLYDCITFWGIRQFLFLHRSAYSSNCSQFAPFLLNAAHSFAYFATASLASAEQTAASARLAVSMRLLIRLQDKHARRVDEHHLTVGRREALTRRSKLSLLSLRPASVTALVKLVMNADSPTRNTSRSSNAS